MMNSPIVMEDFFSPGFKTKPSVHVGSQTLPFWHGYANEQAWEGFFLISASKDDVVVVRDIDPEYIAYWQSLMGDVHIINVVKNNRGEFLSKVILEDSQIISSIQEKMSSKARLMVFLPTKLEQQLADALGIPLHGRPVITARYGTKSGIRKLAQEYTIPMPPGFICTTYEEVKNAIDNLKQQYDTIVIKHDDSASGLFSKKIHIKAIDIQSTLNELIKAEFKDGEHTFVVEGWVKTKASLCAHIEILENQKPIICAAWQQIIDTDGISYIGSGPLMLSSKAMKSFLDKVNKLADALQQKGAVGSYGPDFMITSDDETAYESDTCLLVELNARVPYTALALEAIVQLKGIIGSGFTSSHIHLSKKTGYKEIADVLKKENLLISDSNKKIEGVIPFNTGLLRWNLFDILVIADTWDKAFSIRKKTSQIFS